MTDEERALFGEMARLKAEDAEAARVDAARNGTVFFFFFFFFFAPA